MTTSCCAELQIKVSFMQFSKAVFLTPFFTARLLGTHKLPANLPIEMSFRGYLSFSGLSGVLKVALDGGTRPGDTLQILPLALEQPPNPPLYYLPLCAQGTPFTHPPSWIFQGHSLGHSFTKDNNWN